MIILDAFKSAGENGTELPGIGRKIASFRTLMHYSQEEFAALMCLDSRASIIKMEAAKTARDISLDLQYRLYAFLRMLKDGSQDTLTLAMTNDILDDLTVNINSVIKEKLTLKGAEA